MHPGFKLTTGVDAMPGLVGSLGTASLDGDNVISAVVDARIDPTTALQSSTWTPLDAVNGGAGNDTFSINSITAFAVPDGATVTGVENVTIRGAGAVGAPAGVVSVANVFSGVGSLSVTQATTVGLQAASTTDVSVAGATGNITVRGGKAVTVANGTEGASITIGDTATATPTGAVTVNDTNLGAGVISVNGGTNVTITAASKTSTGAITVGQGGANFAKPSGDVAITSNLSSDATAAVTGGAITVTGGKSVTITSNAVSTAKDNAAVSAMTHSPVTVTGDGKTTSVSVKATSSVTNAAEVATGQVVESATVKFGDLVKGDSVTVSGLTFTASVDLTAAQVASAFANLAWLSTGDTQSQTGPSKNGIYTGALGTSFNGGGSTNYSSGAANGDTVTFTTFNAALGVSLGAANDITAAVNNVSTKSGNVLVTITQGSDGTVTAATNNVINRNTVTINDDATTKAITTVSVDGYTAATLGAGGALDKLTSLSLSNASGNAAVTSASTTLALSLDRVGTTATAAGGGIPAAAAVPRTVTLDNAVTDLAVNTSGRSSNTVLNATGVKNLTINAGVAFTSNTGGAQTIGTGNALESVKITGAGTVNLGAVASTGLKSFDASANTGGVTATVSANAAQVATGLKQYVFSEGNDTVTLTSNVVDVDVKLGGGNDTVVLAAGTTALAKVIDGGTGTNTLRMSAADAEAATGSGDFAARVDNFSVLSLTQIPGSGGAKTVNLANMVGISYVISAGAAPTALGSTESNVVTFTPLKSGQSTTVAGLTVTATGADLTAAQVEAAFLAKASSGAAVVSGTLTGYAITENGANNDGKLTFTATTAGNVADLTGSSLNAPAPLLPTITATVDGAAATTETTVVAFSSLLNGESTVVSDGSKTITVTANSTKETAVYDFEGSVGFEAAVTVGDTISLGGITLTITNIGDQTKVAEDLAILFASFIGSGVNFQNNNGGVNQTFATINGVASADAQLYTWSDDGKGVLTATANAGGPKVDLTAAVFTDNDAAQNPPVVTNIAPSITQGADNTLKATEVAALVKDAADNGVVDVPNPKANVTIQAGAFTGWTANQSTNTVTFTKSGNATNITVAQSGVIASQTEGKNAITETQTVTFSPLLSGQSVTVAGLVYTAPSDKSATEVAAAFASKANGGAGGLTGWTSGVNTGASVTFTSATAGTDVGPIALATAVATAPAAPNVVTTQGGVGAVTQGSLTLTKMANAGTLELTGAAGTTTVTMTDATGTADSLNIVNKVAATSLNFGTIVVSGVETLNLTSSDIQLDNDQDGFNDTVNTATVTLKADAAATINVAGNARTTLVLDAASAAVKTVDASTATGRLTFTTTAGSTMTVKGSTTGDILTASGNGDALFGNAGADTLTVNAGANLVMLYGGTSADTFVFNGASTNVNNAATIMDIAAGDVIKITGATSFVSPAITLDATAVFQDYANAAVKALSTGQMGWFQFQGATYVVLDVAGSASDFQNGTDVIVKIAGLVNLSNASYNATFNTLEVGPLGG